MAQIVNFHKTLNNVSFSNQDDYFHNYASRQFKIDDSCNERVFLCFSDLNNFLVAIEDNFANNISLNNEQMAALSFACVVAANQVYTSEGSGTFGVNQALMAYLKFNFSTSQLLENNDSIMLLRMMQNIIDTLPCHLAVVDPTWSYGHNVVVDGYNTNNYFHINFGWGGTNNGWYLLPSEMPIGMTVIEGVVVDINKKIVNNKNIISKNSIIFPNPAKEYIKIISNFDSKEYVFYNCSGKIAMSIYSNTMETIVDVKNLESGLYLIFCKTFNKNEQIGKIIISH